MKLFLALCFVAASVFDFTQGATLDVRKKRALSREECPAEKSYEECRQHAAEKSNKKRYCHTYAVEDTTILWSSCSKIDCGLYWKTLDEDLTKPYPYCCSTCEIKLDVEDYD